MKREDIKTIEDLEKYFFVCTDFDSLKQLWDWNVGEEYFREEYMDRSGYSYIQDEYLLVFRKELERDVRGVTSWAKLPPTNTIEGYVEAFKDIEEHTGLSLEANLWERYNIGLELLNKISVIKNRDVDREVWDYQINTWEKDVLGDTYTEEDLESVSIMFSALMRIARKYIIQDPFSKYYVWIQKDFEARLQELDKAESEAFEQIAREQSISSLKWVSEKPLESILDKFQRLAPLFSKSPSEGLKLALTAETLKEAENSLEPSFKNLLAVHFLIYNLIKQGFVGDVPNMDGVVKVLTGKKTPYRKSKYKFENEDYALTRDKENLVLDTINSLSQ